MGGFSGESRPRSRRLDLRHAWTNNGMTPTSVVQLMAAGVDGILYAGDGTTRDIVHTRNLREEAQKSAHRRAGRRENAFRMPPPRQAAAEVALSFAGDLYRHHGSHTHEEALEGV